MNFKIVKGFVKKEFKQIIKDPSSILIAFIMPLVLLFLFGYGINFDTNTVKIGVVDNDNTEITRDIKRSLQNTRYLDCYFYKTTNEATKFLTKGQIRGYAVFPINFTKEFKKNLKSSNLGRAKIQIITDGTEPNTAKFVSSYIQGAFNSWVSYKNSNFKNPPQKSSSINVITRAFYNPPLKSSYFILPGSLAIIMTLTGTMLTALVVAREWERGTMEALLTTEMTRGEFVFAKYVAYFILGFLSIIFCLFIIIVIAKVPFYGNYFALLITSGIFMLTSIGTGLLISTIFKDQFTSSQMAGTIGFMPSMMLSGLIYEIDSAPKFIRFLSWFIPAKYYVSSTTSLFLSGTILKVLILNSLYMLIFAVLVGTLTVFFTKQRIEEC